jgi:hypothetical protein
MGMIEAMENNYTMTLSCLMFLGLESDLNKTQDLESRSSHDIILMVAVSSTVVAFLEISVLTLAAGVHYFVRRRRKQSSSSSQPTEPLYDDVNVLPAAVEHQEQDLELTENVAYGSAKTMNH